MSSDGEFDRRNVLKSAAAGGLTVAAATAVLATDARIASADDKIDLSTSDVFLLELGGEVAGYFTECSGIGSEHEIVEHKVVDQNGNEIVRKLPGRLKWTDVSLKRGVTSDLQIWDWRRQVVEGNLADARRPAEISQLSSDLEEKARWSFENAWPSKVNVGSESALTEKSKDCATEYHTVEEVVIVHEGMFRES